MNITKHLPTAGRVFTPLSMVVFLTYEIVQSQPVTGAWAIAVTIAAAFTSIGVEVVGIMSGRALEGFWRIGDAWRSLLCFGLLLLYTVMAVYILRRNDTLMPIPIIAAVVYVVSALADSLERHDEAAHEDEAFERRQRERDRELERQLKRQRQADNTAVRLAKAKGSQKASQVSRTKPAKAYECVCGRVFEGSRSYNAHRRHCEVPANGPAKVYANGSR